MNTFQLYLRRVAPVLVLAGAAVAAAGAQQAGAGAQPRTTRRVIVSDDSTQNMRVTVVLDGLDSLLRSLAQSRALEERIGIALREYSGTPANETRKRALEEQLQKIARNNLQLMSQIQMACTRGKTRVRAPEGYLGVTFNGSYEVNRENNGPEVFRFQEPPEIVTVESGSPADRAGIQGGDYLLSLDGRDVVGRDVIFAQVLVPGRKLPVRVRRDGRDQSLSVVVTKRPEGFGDQCSDIDVSLLPLRTPSALAMPGEAPRIYMRVPAPTRAPAAPEAAAAPAAPTPYSVWTFETPPPVGMLGLASLVAGAQLTTLTDDFKDLTGVESGVMVQRVAPETPAAVAGLRGGDVIVEANERPLTSARLLQRMISDAEEHSVKLKVVRKGKTRTVWLRW